jgi:hypothetical protein
MERKKKAEHAELNPEAAGDWLVEHLPRPRRPATARGILVRDKLEITRR